MDRQHATLGLAAIALLLCQSSAFASASPDPRPPEDMEEVQILASRLKIDELRAEIVKTEDEFYDQFNKLIEDPEMRVICRVEPRIGSHINHRVCEAQFVATANADFAVGLLQGLAGASLGGTYFPPVSPGADIVSYEVEFHRRAVALMKESPALRQLAQRRDMLAVLLKAAQKARFKDRLISRD